MPEDIAYLYAVPFRVRDNDTAKIKDSMLDASYDAGLKQVLEALSPSFIVSMDRKAEHLALKYTINRGCRHIYYTRKRDAHKERKNTLEYLSELFAN